MGILEDLFGKDNKRRAQNTARLFLNGATAGHGDRVEGGLGVLANLFAGSPTDAQNAFESARQDFRQGVHEARWESPYAAFAAETAGSVLPLVGAGKAVQAYTDRQRLCQMLNAIHARWAQRQLRLALEEAKFDKDINAGRLSKQRMEQLNQQRRMDGAPELEEDSVIWTPQGQKHLYERRIVKNGAAPQDVARWQREVFFGNESEVFANPKYPGVSELRTPAGTKTIRGFVTKDPYTGKTVGTSVFKERGKKFKMKP